MIADTHQFKRKKCKTIVKKKMLLIHGRNSGIHAEGNVNFLGLIFCVLISFKSVGFFLRFSLLKKKEDDFFSLSLSLSLSLSFLFVFVLFCFMLHIFDDFFFLVSPNGMKFRSPRVGRRRICSAGISYCSCSCSCSLSSSAQSGCFLLNGLIPGLLFHFVFTWKLVEWRAEVDLFLLSVGGRGGEVIVSPEERSGFAAGWPLPDGILVEICFRCSAL